MLFFFFFFNWHCNPCGFGLLNYRWVFSAGRFLLSAVASGTSNSQLGGPVIRTFQLPPPGVPHVWNDASEPQQRKVELWARNGQEFCRKWRLPRHFWVLLHAVNLRHGTKGFTSPLKEGVLRIFSPEKSNGFSWVWTRELRYQRPACLPLDHWSHLPNALGQYFKRMGWKILPPVSYFFIRVMKLDKTSSTQSHDISPPHVTLKPQLSTTPVQCQSKWKVMTKCGSNNVAFSSSWLWTKFLPWTFIAMCRHCVGINVLM